MNDKNADNQSKTPLSVMLDMFKTEITTHVVNCMEKNNIPPSLMVYPIKDALLDIMQMKIEQISEDYVNLQRDYLKLQEEFAKLQIGSKQEEK